MANISLMSLVLFNSDELGFTLNHFASFGFCAPTTSRLTSSGIAFWLTCKVPTGCNTKSAIESILRKDTYSLLFEGIEAFQLSCFSSSAIKSGITAMAGKLVSFLSPQVSLIFTLTSKKNKEIVAYPRAFHGVGPSSVNLRCIENTPAPKILTDKDAEASIII